MQIVLNNLIPFKNFYKVMIELYLSKVTENSESEQAGKLYARVSYKQAMDIHDMAHHIENSYYLPPFQNFFVSLHHQFKQI